jgi:omega-6 fatty acid desaturase (delta-12 desaturase)
MTLENQGGWRKVIAPFEKSYVSRSVWQIVNTLVPFFILWYLAYISLSVSYLLTLAIAIPAGGFLVRTFIIFHDCCHKSFFKNKAANEIVGTITGILTCVPFHQWRNSHSIHHATSGNLDKRGTGDIWTLTAEEYLASPLWRRMYYRLYRNPFVMFGLGPIVVFLVEYRFNRKRAGWKERINTYITNVSIFGLAGLLCMTLGWQTFLLIQGPIFFISGSVGIWLFYVQHQFEESYYEDQHNWDYVQAAMHGSSFYNLPKFLHWITGNIGFHHIHHLSPRVPNYLLEAAHNGNPELQKVQTITLLTSFQSLKFRVWSEANKKFLSYKELRRFAAERKLSTATKG